MTPKSKSKWLFLLLLFFYITIYHSQTCTDYTVSPNTTISPSVVDTYNTTITVADSFTISDVNISIDISHTWNNDLDIFLISPNGTRVEISTDNGGNGNNYDATFDDDSTNVLPTTNTTITGTYAPEGNLSDFNSENSLGDWILEVSDDFAEDGGTINSVTLNLCDVPNIQGFSFENTLDGWTNPSTGDDIDWTNAQSTPSGGTGPQSGASDGSWFMYTEMSSPVPNGAVGHFEKDFDFTGEINAEMSLDYHMYSADSSTNMGTFNIRVSNDGGTNFTTLFSRTGDQGNGWISETIDLSAYDGQAITIRFEAIKGTSWQSDISIDNVQISSETQTGTPITITADPASKEFGQADPTFTYSITSGSLDPGDSLTGSLSRVAGETVGSYAITQGTLNNPDYAITFVSATFTITEKDTDGDGYFDDVDVDDDNDGILDTDENCVIPGSANPELDQISYTENNFEIFVIGDNTDSGLGFQESGFEQAAFERGLTLTRLNGSNDFSSLPAAPGTDGTAHTTTGTFTNGSLSFSTTAANPETRRNQFRQTTGSSFISGTSGDAIYVKPSIDLQVGEDYTVDIDFTTPVYAFNFDLVDILDTFNDDPGTVVKYEVYADTQLIAYFQSAFLGDDATGNVDVFDANDVSQGTVLVGQNVESSVGFLTNTPVSQVSIVHSVVSGSIFNSRADLHSIDNFIWSTQSFSCFADDLDFDGDGINNDKDIDSDNDGIPDNIEAQSTIEYIAPNYVYGVNGLDTAYGTSLIAINTNDFGNADYVSLDSDGDGLFDTDEVNYTIDINNDGKSDGTVGENGLDNSLYAADDFLDVNGIINDPRDLPDIDGDVLTIGDVDYRDTHLSGTPLITQVLQTDASKSIEITNIHPTNTILANTVKFSLYSNKTGDQSNVIPDEIYTINTDILPGASVVITDLNIVNISSGDDILLLTHPNGNNTNETAYNNRYDTTESINDNTIYVRSDEISATSTDFNSSEWIAFVDDSLDPYADTPERHPHDPLLSEINSADHSSNLALGVHNTGVTTRSGSTWSNGIPDRTRRVVISEDYETSDILKAKSLTVNSNTKLTVNNNFLVVTDDIVLTDNTSEIRLSGTSQLIQTHTSTSKVSGTGNLFIDQNSEIASTYRYNYMSAPVGGNSFTLSNNLKDGSTPTSSTSVITDINFISGLNGATTTPISIASRWIYSFVSADNELSNWVFKGSDTSINATDGFTIKGPGGAQNYTFVGSPNDGTYTTAIGGYQSYLLGNPYPSAINAKKFIDDNIASISGTLYFWQHANETDTGSESAGHNYSGYVGGYSTRNISMGLAANSVSSNTEFALGNDNDFYKSPAEYIAVGQGFFVIGTELGGTIEFSNAQREFITEGAESIFFKGNKKQQKSNKLPIIKLGLDYNNEDGRIMHRQIGISFKEGNTNAFENGYDSYLFDQSFTDFYWKFPNSEDKLVIAGVNNNFNDLEVPLEISVGKDGEIIIGIDEWNINNYEAFIYDKVLDVHYNISEEKINISLPLGLQENRFFLTFSEKETLNNQENHLFKVNAFYNSKTERIQIEKSLESTVKDITLYNILGQKLDEWETISVINSTKIELKTKADKNNIYILKFKIDNEEITKKLILK